MRSGTSVLWPAACVLTPTAWTSASTACCATSDGVYIDECEDVVTWPSTFTLTINIFLRYEFRQN